MRFTATLAILTLLLVGCVSNERIRAVYGPSPAADSPERRPEATSLLGKPLYALAAGTNAEADANLTAARQAWEANPNDLNATIWLGRRLAYLWRMNDAITVFTVALERDRDNVRLLRHRGHRFLNLRRFADARADLETAATLLTPSDDRLEPDGLPNARNQPLTSTAFNVWYHLMLTRYFQGDYAAAAKAWAACRVTSVASEPDNRVATGYWGVLILKRAGRDADAAALLQSIPEGLELLENQAYYVLLRYFQGRISQAEALDAAMKGGIDPPTIGYGVGIWKDLGGDKPGARAEFEKIIAGGAWPAFGFIGAEVELVRAR